MDFPRDEAPPASAGLKASVLVWARRHSRHTDPLASVHIDDDSSDTYSLEDGPFLTAAPNTPLSISFPEGLSTPVSASAVTERTPKTSLSNQSDKTAVETPPAGFGKADVKFDDLEAAHEEVIPCGTNVPTPLRWWVTALLVGVMALAIVGLAVALAYSAEKGWAAPLLVSYAEATGFRHLFFSVPPLLLPIVFSATVSWTESEVRRLQPLVNLGRPDGRLPHQTLLLDYTQYNPFVACCKSVFRRDGLVWLGTALYILTLTLQPLTGALFTVRDVFWIGPDIVVNSTARIGVNRVANFMDLTAFQSAASFASADVMYNVGSPPFASGGYTVAEFELPEGTNGTVYASSRPAVLSQAACVAPDSVAMTHDINMPFIWHHTANFGLCEQTWTVESNATYLYGVTPAGFTGCGESFDGIPLQYRPVLFWFFALKPSPMASAVMCTPHASGQNVGVAIDLATRAMDVTPLQNSPDDASVANIGPFVYNGVFFDGDLDEAASVRADAIQQLLPGAILEAAKMKDPLLTSTFFGNGTTGLAQDVYTTYLSLIAKSIYFVDDQSQISVRVGANCRRLFLVPIAAGFLVGVLGLLSIGTTVLFFCHKSARAGLPLPPHLGTLGAAIWLTAQTDVALALADRSVGPDKLAHALAGHRYRIHKRTGRIFGVVDKEAQRLDETRDRVGRWAAVLRWATS
ncbi:hypothetical protein C2E23DRAFT_181525 [Lenzites betulinus]|nr:hypothetical protein C2E23DRAFT_181525 [Lenzites betulinus]